MIKYVATHVILLFTLNIAKGQFNQYRHHNTLITRVDTIVNSHTSNLGLDNIKQAIVDYELTYTRPDSSKFKYYRIHSGKLLDNARFGVWYIAWGDFVNTQRKNRGIEKEYYINDYLIPNTKYFSDSIHVELEQKQITCYFSFSELKSNSSKYALKIDYWLKTGSDTTFVKCSTIEGLEVFKTTTEYVAEEFNLLYSGYYRRKITGINNDL